MLSTIKTICYDKRENLLVGLAVLWLRWFLIMKTGMWKILG